MVGKPYGVVARSVKSWACQRTDTIDMTGIPSQFHLLGNALSLAKQNHQVISQNIANVNTPGYKARHLEFAEFLQQVESGQANQQAIKDLKVKPATGLEERSDGNNVNIDTEVADLKKNALMYQTYSQLLAAKMATVRRAMSG